MAENQACLKFWKEMPVRGCMDPLPRIWLSHGGNRRLDKRLLWFDKNIPTQRVVPCGAPSLLTSQVRPVRTVWVSGYLQGALATMCIQFFVQIQRIDFYEDSEKAILRSPAGFHSITRN